MVCRVLSSMGYSFLWWWGGGGEEGRRRSWNSVVMGLWYHKEWTQTHTGRGAPASASRHMSLRQDSFSCIKLVPHPFPLPFDVLFIFHFRAKMQLESCCLWDCLALLALFFFFHGHTGFNILLVTMTQHCQKYSEAA